MLGFLSDHVGVGSDKLAQPLIGGRVKKGTGPLEILAATGAPLVVLVTAGDDMDGKDFPATRVICKPCSQGFSSKRRLRSRTHQSAKPRATMRWVWADHTVS